MRWMRSIAGARGLVSTRSRAFATGSMRRRAAVFAGVGIGEDAI